MSYVITALLGVLAGFIAARFIRVKGFHKDVAQVLLECMELEEKQAAALGKKSMIDYVVEAYGMDYAVVHYGSIFHILRGMPKKDEKLINVENAVGAFLQKAMHDDIEKYKNRQQNQK